MSKEDIDNVTLVDKRIAFLRTEIAKNEKTRTVFSQHAENWVRFGKELEEMYNKELILLLDVVGSGTKEDIKAYANGMVGEDSLKREIKRLKQLIHDR